MQEQPLNNYSSDNIDNDLSRILSTLMETHNVSESELARALNLPYNTIHRLISRHTTDPRISTLKAIATYFNISLDSLFSDKKKPLSTKKNDINEVLLHYILKQSHHLYPASQDGNDDYADFVLGLLKEIQAIDTSENNLIKIIDLAISSLSSYKEKGKRHHAM